MARTETVGSTSECMDFALTVCLITTAGCRGPRKPFGNLCPKCTCVCMCAFMLVCVLEGGAQMLSVFAERNFLVRSTNQVTVRDIIGCDKKGADLLRLNSLVHVQETSKCVASLGIGWEVRWVGFWTQQ